MLKKDKNVLFIVRTMSLGGTENVVLQLCEILSDEVNKIVVCSSGGVHEEILKKMGIKHYTVPDIASKNLRDMAKIFSTIKRIIKDENITIIHSHHRMAALYAELASKDSIIKIANAHNTFDNKKKLTKIAYKHTQLIAVGEMVKKNLVDYFKIPEQQVVVIHNAIKPFEGEYQKIELLEQERANGNILIGNVGRLSEQKGMEYFIDAAEITIKKHSNVRFFIVGDGELKDELINRVKEKHLENLIQFLGYRSDIQNTMKQFDFVVLSSLWEGLPLTPIEAFSVGKTVIGTSVDGTPEIIEDKENGLLVNAKDVRQLSDAMNMLIEDENLRKELEVNAKKCYMEEFSFDKLAKEYRDYYGRL